MTPDELAKLIPDEAVKALQWSLRYTAAARMLDDNEVCAALAAALNAWSGMSQLDENDSATVRGVACLILPLKETPNAE
jgi:hypothetical protein